MARSRAVFVAAAVLALALGCAADVSPRAMGGDYFLGVMGDSCAVTCGLVGRDCSKQIVTNNGTDLFTQLGVKCKANPLAWWAPNQPGFVSGAGDPNYGECLGYTHVPAEVSCQAKFWSVQRLCHCVGDVTKDQFFGTGYSGGTVYTNETRLFAHTLDPSIPYGVMTHFWVTAPNDIPGTVIVRYYVDGETTPSVEFQPSMAAGVGFLDDTAPWGTKWFGMGAGAGHGKNYFHNFRIPFYKSIIVSVFHPNTTSGGFYMIMRGAAQMPVHVGGFALPMDKKPRMHLQKTNKVLQPLELLNIVDVPTGSGIMFMSTLAAASGNLNFLEGCFHAYSPYNRTWPGALLSTGTEDYFDSAWYFDAGEFHMPVSGFTHLTSEKNNITWSAYRFHEMDPLPFNDGFRFQWRVGDTVDPETGLKCFMESGGAVVGSPTPTSVQAYGWYYTW